MPKTEKNRKSPTESATMFTIGYIKKGNDRNMWKIIATSSGVHRWQKIANMHSKTIKKSKRVDDKDKDNNMQKSILSKNVNISTNELVKIGKKNKVVTSGASKSALALRIYNIRGNGLSTQDLEKIADLLPSKEKREVKKMIIKQHDNPVTDYKGMWKPAPKTLNKMSRTEMIHSLRGFRDAWEREMGRNQDLSDERLAAETEKNLREHLTWYYSDMAKNQAANWIRYNK
jgi:arsenate reductase-like glutaredoxin family protein